MDFAQLEQLLTPTDGVLELDAAELGSSAIDASLTLYFGGTTLIFREATSTPDDAAQTVTVVGTLDETCLPLSLQTPHAVGVFGLDGEDVTLVLTLDELPGDWTLSSSFEALTDAVGALAFTGPSFTIDASGDGALRFDGTLPGSQLAPLGILMPPGGVMMSGPVGLDPPAPQLRLEGRLNGPFTVAGIGVGLSFALRCEPWSSSPAEDPIAVSSAIIALDATPPSSAGELPRLRLGAGYAFTPLGQLAFVSEPLARPISIAELGSYLGGIEIPIAIRSRVPALGSLELRRVCFGLGVDDAAVSLEDASLVVGLDTSDVAQWTFLDGLLVLSDAAATLGVCEGGPFASLTATTTFDFGGFRVALRGWIGLDDQSFCCDLPPDGSVDLKPLIDALFGAAPAVSELRCRSLWVQGSLSTGQISVGAEVEGDWTFGRIGDTALALQGASASLSRDPGAGAWDCAVGGAFAIGGVALQLAGYREGQEGWRFVGESVPGQAVFALSALLRALLGDAALPDGMPDLSFRNLSLEYDTATGDFAAKAAAALSGWKVSIGPLADVELSSIQAVVARKQGTTTSILEAKATIGPTRGLFVVEIGRGGTPVLEASIEAPQGLSVGALLDTFAPGSTLHDLPIPEPVLDFAIDGARLRVDMNAGQVELHARLGGDWGDDGRVSLILKRDQAGGWGAGLILLLPGTMEPSELSSGLAFLDGLALEGTRLVVSSFDGLKVA